MKRIFALLLCLALMASVAACAPAPAPEPAPAPSAAVPAAPSPEPAPAQDAALYTAGTYTSTQTGHNGAVTVEVTFTDSAITAVNAKDHAETERIGDAAINAVATTVVEHQTMDVDIVSGATVTFYAVLNGVKDCIAQAGGDETKLAAYEVAKQADETLEAPIVVIGAGAAGLSAAVEAAKQGVDVIVVEKLGILGGSTSHASGVVLTTSDEEKAFTAKDHYDLVMFKSTDKADTALVQRVADDAANNVEWLRAMGVPLNLARATYLEWNVATVSPDAKGGVVRPNGMKIINGLESEANKTGKVRVELNTRATSIIQQDGVIKGVECERKDGSKLVVNAQAVIIASGGYDNGERMLEYEPNAKSMRHVSAVGNVGDGIDMAEKLGAATQFNGGRAAMGNAMGMNKYGLPANYMMINGHGKRLVDESAHYMFEYNAIMDGDSPDIYRLYDSNNEDLTKLEENVAKGIVFKADTLDELAKLIKVDPAALKETADRYNSMTGKQDEDFGKAAEKMLGLAKAPFYAIKVIPEILLSVGGIVINENAQVLDKSGNAIPMLYAAGETANPTYFFREYAYSGAAILHAVATGRYAAQDAVSKLK